MDDDWFGSDLDDSVDDGDEGGNLDDSWETCDESESNDEHDEVIESSDEDSDSESDGGEDASVEDSNDFEDYGDEDMLMEILSHHFGGWQDFEDFDDYDEEDYDTEPSEWSDDDSNNSWGQSILWQPKAGRDTPVNEEHLVYGPSINIVDFLRSRERGKSHLWKNKAPSSLLTFCLKARWSSVAQIEMLFDAAVLLGRTLYRWEGAVLSFLQNHAIERSPKSTRSTALTHMISPSFASITFTDIIHALVKGGVNLLARDEQGNDLLITVIDQFTMHEDSADFIELLIKNGLDIEKNGDQALRALCDSFHANSVTNARLRTIRLILDAGLTLSEITKRDLITKFSRNLLSLANETAVEIVKLLLSHGCHANLALLNMESQEYLFASLDRKENFRYILDIAMILLENDAQVNSAEDDWKPNFVFRMLDVAANQPNHPSMLSFLEKCIHRGLDLTVTSNSLKNLMMGFCEKYKHEDLPQIIRLLCSSGIDVNQVDKFGQSALIYLSFNRPICRKSICDAVRTLLELNIDAKRARPSGSNALLSFLKSEPIVRCCKYKISKLLNESSYWETLDLLLDTGIGVNETDSDDCNSLTSFLYNWSRRPCYGFSICKDCLNSDFPLRFENEAMESLGIEPFEPVLRFVKRLLEAGANTEHAKPPFGYKNPLHYVCCCFEGELLIALVSLFCKSGVDVNAKTTWITEDKSEVNAIELIKEANPTQVHLIGRLIDVMKPYGFKI